MNRFRMWWKQTSVYAWYRLHFYGQKVAVIRIEHLPPGWYRGMSLDIGGVVVVELLDMDEKYAVVGRKRETR